MLVRDVHRVSSDEGRTTRLQFVHYAAEAVDIRAMINAAASHDLLWRGVEDGSNERSMLRLMAAGNALIFRGASRPELLKHCFDWLRQSPVGDVSQTFLIQKYVSWFEIT